MIVNRGEYSGERFVEIPESVFILLRFERVLKGIDDVSEASTESGTCDSNECSECSSVESSDGLGDKSRDKNGEDLFGTNLHDLYIKEKTTGQ